MGNKIREIRVKKNMSRQDLAAGAGLSITTVYNHEKGITSPKYVDLLAISKVLGSTPDELMGLKNDN